MMKSKSSDADIEEVLAKMKKTISPPSEPATPATGQRPVSVKDVIPYAKKNHGLCFGRGAVTVDDRQNACPCATKRFVKANRGLITVDEKGVCWWLSFPTKEVSK